MRFGESESAVDSCMRTSLLDLLRLRLSPHESAMFCTVSQDLRISESAVDSCTIAAGSRGAGGGAANGVHLKNVMLLLTYCVSVTLQKNTKCHKLCGRKLRLLLFLSTYRWVCIYNIPQSHLHMMDNSFVSAC